MTAPRFKALIAAAPLLLMLLSAGNAAAQDWGPCVPGSSYIADYTGFKGVTDVHNQTSVTRLWVNIYRGSTLKKNTSLNPGKRTRFKAGMKKNGSADISVEIYVDAAKATVANCAFRIGEDTKDNLTWAYAEGQTAVCPSMRGLAVACKMWFKDDTVHTDFMVKDVTQ